MKTYGIGESNVEDLTVLVNQTLKTYGIGESNVEDLTVLVNQTLKTGIGESYDIHRGV